MWSILEEGSIPEDASFYICSNQAARMSQGSRAPARAVAWLNLTLDWSIE